MVTGAMHEGQLIPVQASELRQHRTGVVEQLADELEAVQVRHGVHGPLGLSQDDGQLSCAEEYVYGPCENAWKL